MRDVAQHHSHVEEIKENESENGVYDESISGDIVPQSTIHCTVEDGISHHISWEMNSSRAEGGKGRVGCGEHISRCGRITDE